MMTTTETHPNETARSAFWADYHAGNETAAAAHAVVAHATCPHTYRGCDCETIGSLARLIADNDTGRVYPSDYASAQATVVDAGGVVQDPELCGEDMIACHVCSDCLTA